MTNASDLAKQLQTLARTPGTFRESSLPIPTDRKTVTGAVGKGKRADFAVTVGLYRYAEEFVAYSEVLVTEAGVFELPPGWPDTNTYPGFTFADDDLPVLGDPYVIQRRTHAYVYAVTGKGYEIHDILTTHAKPWAEDVLVFPIPSGSWSPVIKHLASANVGNVAALDSVVAMVVDTYG